MIEKVEIPTVDLNSLSLEAWNATPPDQRKIHTRRALNDILKDARRLPEKFRRLLARKWLRTADVAAADAAEKEANAQFTLRDRFAEQAAFFKTAAQRLVPGEIHDAE
jgi:hypothetical protein